MESGPILLTLRYKDKLITISPPKSLMRLKYSLNKYIDTSILPSSFMILHESCEVDSQLYESFIMKNNTELTIFERELEPSAFIFITTPFIMVFKHPYKDPERLENTVIHWSAVSFILPHRHPLLIAGDRSYELDIGSYMIGNKAKMQFSRYYFASAVVKEFIYVLGGVSIEGYSNICERYNTNTDQWEYIQSHLGSGKSGMAACQWGNLKIFLFGGLDGVNYSADIECYDIDKGVWRLLNVTLPWDTYYIAAHECQKGVILLGGKDNRECVCLDVASLCYTLEGNLPNSVECSKFTHSPKRVGNSFIFLNLDCFLIRFMTDSKKFEIIYDPKKNISS